LPPSADPNGTPFEIVGAHRPVARATKAGLMPISRYLEALAGEGTQPPVLLACFQEARHFTPRTAERYARIAERSPLVAALGVGLGEEPIPGVRGAHLTPDDPLRGEWNVIVIGPHQAAALVARDLGDTGPEPDRRFEFALTHDRELVAAASRSLLRFLAPARADVLTA
jgi:DICT domain-containing protein